MNGRQSRAWWLWAVSTALLAASVWGLAYLFGPRSAGGTAHPAAPCTTCHDRLNEDAAMYVAVDGEELPAERIVRVPAGGNFEVDFHFTGMTGDVSRHSGVGMSLEVPSDPVWGVTFGSLNHPEAWSQAGKAERFWDLTWDRSTNGSGPLYTRWIPTEARPEVYYLSFAGFPWSVAAIAQAANDRGVESEGDLDRVANHMGADAVVTVPAETPPGRYQVTVFGIGHDLKGNKAYVSRAIDVEVFPAGEVNTQPPLEAPDGENLYTRFCSGCHGATPNTVLISRVQGKTENDIYEAISEGRAPMPAFSDRLGGKLTSEEITAVAKYVLQRAEAPQRVGGAPLIPHLTEGREACLDCHRPGGSKPVPSNHSIYDNNACTKCHKPGAGLVGAPSIPHPLEGFESCTVCHSVQGPVILPEDHVGRPEASCVACHQPSEAGQGP
jgi:cytochrome c553